MVCLGIVDLQNKKKKLVHGALGGVSPKSLNASGHELIDLIRGSSRGRSDLSQLQRAAQEELVCPSE